MKPSVLLVTTRTDWLGTARIPRTLAKAGFDVAVLAPPDALISKSAYIARIGFCAPRASPVEWLGAAVQIAQQTAPRLIIPGDEVALRLLFKLVLDAPPGLPSAGLRALQELVVASVGDPRHYMTSIDKTLLPAAAEAIGVRVPRYAIAASADEAVAHAGRLGLPVVLKRRLGFSSGGIAFVDSIDDVAAKAASLLKPEPIDLGEVLAPQLLVQAFVAGPHHSTAMVRLEGRLLAAFAWERFVLTHPVTGHTSVLRFTESPETLEFSRLLGQHLDICGFSNIQYIIDEATGDACLLEINRRVVTHMHLGERVGCDLGVALFDAVDGRRVEPPVPRIGAEDKITVFPREWLRDPASPYLDRHPADIPWDEPRLMAAMVAMWREA
jgi:biotin carboxylase